MGDIERTADQLATLRGVLRPGNQGAERNIGSRLVASQVALFHKVIAKLAESESVLVVVEAWTGKHAKPDIAEARGVAISMLQAEAHHAANHQRRKVLIEEHGWVDDFSEHVEHVQDIKIIEERQVDKVLDLAIAHQRP